MCKSRKNMIFLATFAILLVTGSGSAFSMEEEEEKTYTLEDLRAALYANNTDIRKQGEEYYRSTLDLTDAWWTLGPTVSATAAGNYMFNPPSVNYTIDSDEIIDAIDWPEILGHSTRPSASDKSLTIDEELDHTLYNFGLSLQQPVFTWGKIANSIKLYQGISEARRMQLEGTEHQLETELETRLCALHYLKQILLILEEEKEYASQLVSFTELAEKNGMMVHQEVLDAKMQAKQIEITEQNVKEEVSSQLLELQSLTRIQDLTLENIGFAVSDDEILRIINQDRAAVLEKALSGDSNTMRLLLQTEAVREIAVKIAKGSVNWKPDIALQLSLNYSGSKFPFFEEGWQDADDYSLNLTLGISTTVWDGGRRVRDVSRRLSEERSAQIDTDDARDQIRHTLESQWNTVDVCTMRMEYQELKIETALLKVEQQELMYKSGYSAESDVLLAKIDWCNERIGLVQESLKRSTAAYTIRYLSE